MLYTVEHGSYQLRAMPGCGAIAVLCKTVIAEEYRGMGYGQALQRHAIATAKALGYSMLVATIREDNAVMRHVAEKAGFTPIEMFTNRSNGAAVNLYCKILED